MASARRAPALEQRRVARRVMRDGRDPVIPPRRTEVARHREELPRAKRRRHDAARSSSALAPPQAHHPAPDAVRIHDARPSSRSAQIELQLNRGRRDGARRHSGRGAQATPSRRSVRGAGGGGPGSPGRYQASPPRDMRLWAASRGYGATTHIPHHAARPLRAARSRARGRHRNRRHRRLPAQRVLARGHRRVGQQPRGVRVVHGRRDAPSTGGANRGAPLPRGISGDTGENAGIPAARRPAGVPKARSSARHSRSPCRHRDDLGRSDAP